MLHEAIGHRPVASWFISGLPPRTPALLKSLSNFADAKSRDRSGALMSTSRQDMKQKPYTKPQASRAAARFAFQPQSAVADSPFQGHTAGHPIAGGRLRCFDVRDISLTLHRAADAAFISGLPPRTPALLKSLSNFADAKSRDRSGALMSTSR